MPHPQPTIRAALLYPVAILGALAFGLLAHVRGWNLDLALIAATVAAAALVMGLERALPFRTAWNEPQGDTKTDLVCTAMALLVPLVHKTALDVLVLHLHNPLRVLETQPFAVQLVLTLILADLGAYLGHRLVHAIPALWKLHSVHHGAKRLYWMNTYRFHPVDLWVIHACSATPLVLLGVGKGAFFVYALVATVHGLFQHSNIAHPAGSLEKFVHTAPLHRWHHVETEDHQHHNFGAILTLWDRLARTYHRAEPLPLEIGPERRKQ